MIEIKNLSKSIKGNLVLDNISCRLDAGKVYGIYGRNGSGKTMLMRCILGLIFADSGFVKIDGCVVGRDLDFPKAWEPLLKTRPFFPMRQGMRI